MPSEFGFEPGSPRYGLFLVADVLVHIVHTSRIFGALLGDFSDISRQLRALEGSLTP